MSSLTDTHCHIHSIGAVGAEPHTAKLWAKKDSLTEQSVIDDATELGVDKLITVGCNLPDSRLATKLASKQQSVWASVGIHPHEASGYVKDETMQKQFAELITKPRVVAIGECGLDYFYNHSNASDQAEVLKFQLKLASDNNLPVIFHVREAFDDFWPIYDSFPKIRGVLHSFTDSTTNLEAALKRGLYIGINGIATFTKDEAQTAMFKQVPLSSLLLETDSPYLSPAPMRGSVNEPKNVKLVAEYLAGLRSQSLAEVANASTTNALSLFNL